MLAVWSTPRALSLPALGDQILEVTLAGTGRAQDRGRPTAAALSHDSSKTHAPDAVVDQGPLSISPPGQNNTPVIQDMPASVSSVPAAERNFLLGRLNSELSRHLIYPPLARERRWEGTVWLGFRLESNGRLDQVHIARGSGYDVLDQSALHSLGKVGHLPGAENVLRGRDINMQLPVIYRLIEN